MNWRAKNRIKRVLSEIPFAADIYWQIGQSEKPLTKSFSLNRLARALPDWCAQAESARTHKSIPRSKQQSIFLFATLRQWIQQATLLGIAFAGQGHQPTLCYLPYSDWRHQTNRFDLRRQNIYAKNILSKAHPLLETVSFFEANFNPVTSVRHDGLPTALAETVKQISVRDVQYTLQIEDFDIDEEKSEASKLYYLRLERNTDAAIAALTWLKTNMPDVVVVPNGSILEFGAIYQVARFLEIPVVTYEFGEQRKRIWLAQNDEVMLQDTRALWETWMNQPLDEDQWEGIKNLYASRRQANLWENFSRRWQGLPNQGGEMVRNSLGLDLRPIVLLAANVIGDSLTLGRQVFSRSMTEWLERTIHYFNRHPDVQLVIRVHPGEKYTKGPSVAQIVQKALSELPEHIHLIPADAQINTYDLVEIACLGLVYTTTVGMEMAMSGIPVIIAGQTHYRNKGFTLDPQTWEEFYAHLDRVLSNPSQARLPLEQVQTAWNYAYRFFFDYPSPFPWHLHFFALNELKTWPLERVLSEEGQEIFGDTFQYMTGEHRDWSNINTRSNNPIWRYQVNAASG